MADVYVGRDVNDHDELVAIKVMRDEFGRDPIYMRMFSDEAKLLSRLSHPNLIRHVEYGIASDRRYLVMELLSGRSLLEVWEALLAADTSVSFEVAAFICARIADGLHAAHELRDERGTPLAVIHRDVNPSNVFVTVDGQVKLIDFGLAKAHQRRSATTRGIMKGKVPYVAPEQVRGAELDRRVDIFALGATLYELSTMKRLFKRESDLETIRAIVDCKVPDPRAWMPTYPDALFAVVLRALSPEPDDRYPSAAELAYDLDEFVGAGVDLSAELSALLTRLFPNDAAKLALWTRNAAKVPDLTTLSPPPAPVMHGAAIEILSEADFTLDDE